MNPNNLLLNDNKVVKLYYDNINEHIKSLRGKLSGKSRKKEKNK